MSISATQNLAKRQQQDIVLVRGNDGRRPCYYYVLAQPSKKAGLLALQAGSGADIAAYGTILYSGYGKKPPVWVQNKMYEEYGFEA